MTNVYSRRLRSPESENRITYGEARAWACAKAITTVCKGMLMNTGRRRLERDLSDIKTFFPSAALFTSPWGITSGTSASLFSGISISNMATLTPFKGSPKVLNTADFPPEHAVKDEAGAGWELQQAISEGKQ